MIFAQRGKDEDFAGVREGEGGIFFKRAGVGVNVIGIVIVKNGDFIFFNQEKVSGGGEPGEEGVAEALLSGDGEVFVFDQIVNIDFSGLKLAFFGLGIGAGKGRDDALGKGGGGSGGVEDFFVVGRKLQIVDSFA